MSLRCKYVIHIVIFRLVYKNIMSTRCKYSIQILSTYIQIISYFKWMHFHLKLFHNSLYFIITSVIWWAIYLSALAEELGYCPSSLFIVLPALVESGFQLCFSLWSPRICCSLASLIVSPTMLASRLIAGQQNKMARGIFQCLCWSWCCSLV